MRSIKILIRLIITIWISYALIIYGFSNNISVYLISLAQAVIWLPWMFHEILQIKDDDKEDIITIKISKDIDKSFHNEAIKVAEAMAEYTLNDYINILNINKLEEYREYTVICNDINYIVAIDNKSKIFVIKES